MEKFLALNHVKEALGVENRTFVVHSKEVHYAMYSDKVKNCAGGIPQLLEDGIKVLIFDGEYDLIDNWLGKIYKIIFHLSKYMDSIN